MTWHGSWVVVKKDQKFHSTFYHNVSDDKKEDSFVVISDLAEALKKTKAIFPNAKNAVLMTDGAGCYSGVFLAINLVCLVEWTGIRITDHFISESGQGKSILDGMFGVLTQFIRRLTRTGSKYDILKAEHLQQALCSEGCPPGNIAEETIFDRAKESHVSKNNFTGLKKFKHRKYLYSERGNCVGIKCFEHSFCNNEGVFKSIDALRNMMFSGKFQAMPNTILLSNTGLPPLKPVVWEEDHSSQKALKKGQRIEKVAGNRRSKFAAVLSKAQEAKATSRAFPCTTANCHRVFLYRARLLRHLAKGTECGPSKQMHRKCRSVKGTVTLGTSVMDEVIQVLKTDEINLPQKHLKQENTEQTEVLLERSYRYKLADGSTWKAKPSSTWTIGHARTYRI